MGAGVDIAPQTKRGVEVIDQGRDGIGGNVLTAVRLCDEVADFVVAIVGRAEEQGSDQLALVPDTEEDFPWYCRTDNAPGHRLHTGITGDRLVSKAAEMLFVLADELE